MSSMWTVMIAAFLPATGNFIGGMLAETWRTPKWLVGAALHGAAGIAIAVVSLNLMPRITQTLPAWQTAVAFSVGALISVLLSRTVGRIRRSLGANTAQLRGAWMVYIAIATDLVSDGLMTGIGSAVSSKLGLLLALSQLVANIPGGFATGANFRHKGVDRKKRFLVAFSYPLPALVAASVGFFLLRHTGDVSKNLALAVIVGILLVTTAEDTIPQGDEPQPPRWISTSAFSIGFVMFVLFSTYFE